ncbi:rod shape-determining protein RodA [Merismopedia glauca]|uniref:Peptidoglycan glycosyltransferase RodA n=1 Tax=Merismopedia glauca CCAP 1448/3 TaxID=1296344 RepID=A0A2T1C2A9_9CYAN|nr:rod shape-determining protein RodA [Merismopedia glauca]PSB02253.1 rod shape-determining protein RodA [Merismopedia glauca CCAP 1448/3]
MFRKPSKVSQSQAILSPWDQIDWVLLISVVGLTFFGGVAIRTTELHQGLIDWWQHWIFGGLGVGLALWLSRSRYDILLQWQWPIYALTNLSLLAVKIVGSSAKGGQRWLSIAGFQVQPSEFAKLGLIITLAAFLHYRNASNLPNFAKALGIMAIPWLLVFIQPDLGTSLVFGAITLGMLFWANASIGWLILLVSPIISAILFAICFKVFLPGWLIWVALMGVVAWFSLPWKWWTAGGAVAINLLGGEVGQLLWSKLQDYQKQRLITFIDPDADALGWGYQLIQSRTAIGAGGLLGKGLSQGTQTQLNFVPEQHTDFIFTAIGEEFGFVGSMLTILVFWLVCVRLVLIAKNAKDNFGSLMAIGVFAMIFFQVIVNIGMTINLAPVTGIPLPWLSYGRSALLTNFLAIGIVESVANYRQRRNLYLAAKVKYKRRKAA